MLDKLTIGRTSDNDIVISHPHLSSHHATISLVDNKKLIFLLKDLDSTNGTFKNGQRIESAEFNLNDKIKLGHYELQASDFLDLFSVGQASHKSAPKDQANKRHNINLYILSGLTITFGFLYLFSLPSTVNIVSSATIIQFIALFLLFMLSIQIIQSVYRYTNQLRSEKQYREILFNDWEKKSNYEFDKYAVKQEVENDGWQGFRKFEVAKKIVEAKGITSFYLVPHDKQTLPSFKPGQYLTFKLDIPDQKKPIIRCYSLSDSPNPKYYRVTIKKNPPPRDKPDAPWGVSSSHFHEQVEEGSILDVKAPSGKFFLDVQRETSIVLIAGGVGLTPMVSMLNAQLQINSKREIWFFYGVRNGDELAMRAHLEEAAKKFNNVNLHLCFSNPLDTEKEGIDYQHAERVSVELFKKLLPSNNYEFYMCGPPPFMNSITADLKSWGVPDSDVNQEAFGAPTTKTVGVAAASVETSRYPDATVTFAKSGKSCQWKASSGLSILEMAEENELDLDFGCRAGNCGTCLLAIRAGKVHYLTEHDADPESGSCLVCISAPDGDLVLDA